MVGKTIGHYRIEAKLGEGGMGTVYKAEDLRLRRPVAVKFLKPGDRTWKMLREARAASRLAHPNVATVYEVGEQDGVEFIVMEFVDGVSLASRLQQGALSLREVLSIAIQIAGALAVAESRNIVHRDIKPANLMVTEEGQVKILDFGLAEVKLDEQERTETLCALPIAEGIPGTLAYLAPEQLEGKSATIESDIFSLGVVLYEMITGKHPFRRDTAGATIKSIISDSPKPPTTIRSEVPQALVTVVSRCLEKDPGKRPPTMELRQTLEGILNEINGEQRWRWVATKWAAMTVIIIVVCVGGYWVVRNWPQRERAPAAPKTVLVLPVTNLNEPENEYSWTVSQALNEKAESYEMIRPISMRQIHDVVGLLQKDLKGALDEETARAVSRRVQPDYLLLTSFKQLGKSFNIHCSLMDPIQWSKLHVADVNGRGIDEELWSKLDDLARIFFSEKFLLNLAQRQPIGLGTKSPLAYRYFLLGELAEADYDFDSTIDSLEKAVQTDPHFATAWSRLALARYETQHPKGEIEAARQRALAESGSASEREKFLIRTIDSILRRDRSAATSSVDAILNRYNQDERALILAGDISLSYELPNQAIRAGHFLEQVNPYSYYAQEILQAAFLDKHDWKEVEKSLEKMRRLAPYRANTHTTIGLYFFVRGDYDKALEEFQAAEKYEEGFSLTNILRGRTYEALGRLEEARHAYEKIVSTATIPRRVSEARLGLSRLALGQDDLERARQLLELLIREKNPSPQALDLQGELLIRQKRQHELEGLIERFAQLSPDSPYLLRLRGRLLLLQGKTKDGLSQLKKAAESASVFPALYFYCDFGTAALECGQTQLAISAFKELLDICPGHAIAHLGMAVALERTMPTSAAEHRKQFRKIWSKADPDVLHRHEKRYQSLRSRSSA